MVAASAPGLIVASRAHGETGVIARILTQQHGIVAGYVAGGRGRGSRPIVIPGNKVAAQWRAKSPDMLPFMTLELTASIGPWLSEPVAAAAINWATSLTALALPERAPFPLIYSAFDGLLDAICSAPSARGWLYGMIAYETLMLDQMGYGGALLPSTGDLNTQFETFRQLHKPLARYLLADAPRDGMAARVMLGEKLARMVRGTQL